jgi:hypothetical protein
MFWKLKICFSRIRCNHERYRRKAEETCFATMYNRSDDICVEVGGRGLELDCPETAFKKLPLLGVEMLQFGEELHRDTISSRYGKHIFRNNFARPL